ncbi:pyruvate formate-lyase-activating protein [Salisediminibacterium halotolerans]|uniref:Pyruvate formate-lyase-activating enzyme n=1 Tax=Salisediminibacterium halotolerans TaxID=517425 RepID=A0A1H9RPH3_9BACI|nr:MULTISPECIES: pyruvate formate-lyase-activating protein [Salisediminibacterium]RLJ77837.1 pyruvate formate lyase activating enzyme [Actinophytocola xinjiangensis]RPE82816.1 pyruvate formate lyase activating enzyme [Salisediminibacterium halotolerans]TWG36814.1 pyruvate formate lyase activating enzyme [Salisediminibacterium halotolerans]SER73789.1 pyruvate formate lyase activating enzyme [Salisediminibacterium haloalkalitolerans]GEL08720.1 pyruvate formate-lyase-activating enzyme [Salisedimi
MQGRIHSIETTGMVDGPGIRYIIFAQGCLLRCQYCHNPDSWERNAGQFHDTEDLVADIKKYLPYMKHSGGGVTVSGGEPLLQMPFLIDLFKKLKSLGIHTAIDSSGGCYSETESFQAEFQELLNYTDLFLVDLKQIDETKHRELTGSGNRQILSFAKQLSDQQVPMWIRHVLVPGKTDDSEDLQKLGQFISSLASVERVEILPYHKMGIYKWEELGIPYPLEGVESPTEAEVERAKRLMNIVGTPVYA